MNRSEQIKVLCVRKNISIAALARMINESPQNLNAKLKRNTVTDEEIGLICNALDVQYRSFFEMENGVRIE